MADIYNTNSIPHGGRIVTILDKGGGALGDYVMENITINRPTKRITRPIEDGSELDEWVIVAGQVTASGVLQIATTATVRPQIGAYFTEDFGSGYHSSAGVYTAGPEKFVIESIGDPHAMNAYDVYNVTLVRGRLT